MNDRILERLNSYIIEDHPDLVIRLNHTGQLQHWLIGRVDAAQGMIAELKEAGKPSMLIEEQVLDAITKDLRPSRFHYIAQLLEEDFAFDYYRMREAGTLTTVITRMIDCCKSKFDLYGFCEANETDKQLRRMVTLQLSAILKDQQGGRR
ncbi:hypothetical protein MUY27_00210 [Mucilaginibacter sp. RS28]|uniref:Uncharacterized protein n=1 Tax=Mucilaginibacter straminoryzae TaxID=2932774 RepID=A0A9X1WYP7_9SPHI|nr:hypothetical protein [Mucilaginibacter straminoryzae]MCJ8208107.1 hypothetical protein [Mucilaginibacter straminoryzae]